MFRSARLVVVACLVASMAILPCRDALAQGIGDDGAPATAVSHVPSGLFETPVEAGRTSGLSLDRLRASAALSMSDQDVFGPPFGRLAGSSPRVLRQTVGSTSRHNFILGAAAAGLVVGGVGLIAYSTTSSCKTKAGGLSHCDGDKVLGAVGISAGAMMLVLWALSK